MSREQQIVMHLDDAGRAALGTLTLAATTAASFMEQLEAWLRVCSLLVGIAVGLITIASIASRMRREKNAKKRQ